MSLSQQQFKGVVCQTKQTHRNLGWCSAAGEKMQSQGKVKYFKVVAECSMLFLQRPSTINNQKLYRDHKWTLSCHASEHTSCDPQYNIHKKVANITYPVQLHIIQPDCSASINNSEFSNLYFDTQVESFISVRLWINLIKLTVDNISWLNFSICLRFKVHKLPKVQNSALLSNKFLQMITFFLFYPT